MKAVIQRVFSASVTVNGKEVGSIDLGLLVLLGVAKEDVSADLDYLVKKTIGLRIFKDENANMNLSISDTECEVLVVSQFTLCADTSKGRRPSFINAATPNIAENIYQQYCEKLKEKNITVKTGQFGSMMEVALINDGPVTILLDSRKR